MTKALLKCHNGLNWFALKVSTLGEILIIATGLLICVDVIMRFAFNMPITGSYDICCLTLSMITFLGWNSVQAEHKHINVSILSDKMPPKLRCIVLGTMTLFTTIACGMMCFGTTAQAIKLTQQKFWSATLEIPYYPFYFFGGACFLIFTLMLCTDTLMYFGALGNKDLMDKVTQWHGGSTD